MNSEAKAAYDASIAEARSSKFVHEEGLACELAGNHYESLENIEKAVSLFEQAKQCYKAWGSQWKTHQMAEKIKHARRGG
jgi:ribosome-binding protein aMBF1 (putative translation factor)